MSPKSGHQPLVYDENLLAQAPEVTQGQRQEGYDADILNSSPPPPSRTPVPSQPYRDHPDVESGSSAHDKHIAASGYDQASQPAKKPFWKTPKGIIIIAVLAIAIVAVVVGVAVGVTLGGKGNDSGGQNQNSTLSADLPGSTINPSPTPNPSLVSGQPVDTVGLSTRTNPGSASQTGSATTSPTGSGDGSEGTLGPSPTSPRPPGSQTPNPPGSGDSL
ncbi:unnamed protein product [Rhizoctonia solani]|uniref:Uncharacterized protein n=1 Tax=Rhizoctonia solani TaxID=456999 RepID=A0A8H2X932_9AGAM|nr:uncharacterized protein RhiXN_12035 [Rhizoctonia solani]QRW26374.1 hypothetical protein RhiXN_12035 [Rhizoctonia solani]CAE6417488.1 unnamed protein product [Rhizoctonia solani]